MGVEVYGLSSMGLVVGRKRMEAWLMLELVFKLGGVVGW